MQKTSKKNIKVISTTPHTLDQRHFYSGMCSTKKAEIFALQQDTMAGSTKPRGRCDNKRKQVRENKQQSCNNNEKKHKIMFFLFFA